MRVAIIADDEEKKGGTSKVISHMVKSLDDHDVHVMYVSAEKYLQEYLKKWKFVARIWYLSKISRTDLSDYDLIITLQPDSHCLRHDNHVVYFQHHIKQFYDLFQQTLRHRKGVRKKIIFLILALIVRIADRIYLSPNLREAHVIVNSETVGQRLIKNNGISNFTIIPPGCDAMRLSSTSQYSGQKDGEEALPLYYPHNSTFGRKKSRQTVLSFSRLNVMQKGIDLVLQTASLLPQYDFIIAGPFDPTIESIVRSCLPRNVQILVKDFSDQEKAELFESCDIFIAPYIEEDFGITPLEANAYGKPVVYCDDSGGILDTQKHLETGYMCKRESDEVAIGIEYCIRNADSMRSACISNASMYSWTAFEKAFSQYIQNIDIV